MKSKDKGYNKKEFNWVGWGPREIYQKVEEILREKKELYNKIKKIHAKERSFKNTIYAIEAAGYYFSDIASQVEFLMNVSPDKKVREAANKAIKRIQEKDVDLEYDPALYRAVEEYAAKKEKLIGADAKLLKDKLRYYRRMGLDLPLTRREELKRNISKLGKLETDFSKNINDYRDHIVVSREELDGLPDTFINRLRKDKEGRYFVSIETADFSPFMANARNAFKRKELVDKFLRKGGQKNLKLLREMLRLRDRNARLLGYAHHGDFATEIRMAKNTKAVLRFIDSLMAKLRKPVSRELQSLILLKRAMTKDPRARIEYYDIAFYINELKKRRHRVDDERIREYFPLPVVKKGLFQIYEKLLSVRFEKLSGYPVWHSDVEHYLVHDKGGSIIGHFFLDLYPREGKFTHAAVWSIKRGRNVSYKSEDYCMPYSAMVTNFPKPTKKDPSLLNHNEVITLFHEFGHIMHGVLTKAPYRSQAGTSVARDFVEAPSQMLENWIWDKKMLNILSSHYKSHKNIPIDLLRNMLKAKRHMIAYTSMRQFIFALFDMLLHTKRSLDINKTYNRLVYQYSGILLPRDNIFSAGFGHLAGYDAGYYSYMWSKVYSSDMFTRFKKEGLLNSHTGGNYRRWILEKGSSMEEIELVKKFLGRKPGDRAFLKEIWLG